MDRWESYFLHRLNSIAWRGGTRRASGGVFYYFNSLLVLTINTTIYVLLHEHSLLPVLAISFISRNWGSGPPLLAPSITAQLDSEILSLAAPSRAIYGSKMFWIIIKF
jgi:hypothetical protein